MYFDYLAESHGVEFLKYRFGFIQYLIEEHICWIAEIYVIPKKRKMGLSHSMALRLEALAKERGCHSLTCQVAIGQKAPERAVMNILSYGFRIEGVDQEKILFSKEI